MRWLCNETNVVKKGQLNLLIVLCFPGSDVMVAKQILPDNTRITDVDSGCCSSLSVDIDLLKDRMNFMDIDEIIQPLRYVEWYSCYTHPYSLMYGEN